MIYKKDSAVGPDLLADPHNTTGNGMFPKPPLLFRGVGVTDDETWESYTKVAGGIRMTGMPGFKDRLSDTQMWQGGTLGKNADKLPPSRKGGLGASPGEGSPAGGVGPRTRGHR